MMMMVLVLGVLVVSVLFLHVKLLELVPGNQLGFLLRSLDGGEGSASSVLALHVNFLLSLGSLSVCLHTDLLSCGRPRCT
jgi:hypothetical protein